MTDAEVQDEALRLQSRKPFNMEYRAAVMRWTQGKLSSRPEHYMGRGVNTGDLNSFILEMLWSGITQDVGIDAADNFIRLVEECTDMSATAFLNAFYAFFKSDFNGRPYRQTPRDRIKFIGRSDDPQTIATLMEGTINILANKHDEPDEPSSVSASLHLKADFLRKHGKKVKWPAHIPRHDDKGPFGLSSYDRWD